MQEFRWDTGPSVITMRPVFEELFSAAGRRMEDYLDLLPVEPLTRYFYPDGTVLDATRDLPRMLEQVRALDVRDPEGYQAYLGYVAHLHRITGPAFIYGAPPTWRTVAQVAPADALRLEPWLTMDAAIRRTFARRTCGNCWAVSPLMSAAARSSRRRRST